jgi:hypothetical protein
VQIVQTRVPLFKEMTVFDSNNYREAIQKLPKPAWAQTERFARYVACAHSWYKG